MGLSMKKAKGKTVKLKMRKKYPPSGRGKNLYG
jgi:hypothetical protein